jgi:hypothetical protein
MLRVDEGDVEDLASVYDGVDGGVVVVSALHYQNAITWQEG